MKLPKNSVITCCLAVIFTPSFTQAAVTTQAYYPVGEGGAAGPANQPLDASGNGRNYLFNIGGASITTTAPSPFSTANYDFGGNQGYYDIGYDAPENNVGVQGWFRISDLAVQSSHIFGTGHEFEGLNIGWDTGTNQFTGSLGGITPSVVGSGYAAVANAWVHLALVRDAGIATFYVNGVANGVTSSFVPTNAAESHVGVSDAAAAFYTGSIDEGAIFTFTAGEFSPTQDLGYNKPIPEPGACILMALGACLVTMTRRRQAI